MEKTKVISVRLSKSLLQALDKIQYDHKWWTRNSIIEQLIAVFVECTDAQSRYDILSAGRFQLNERSLKLDFKEKKELEK